MMYVYNYANNVHVYIICDPLLVRMCMVCAQRETQGLVGGFETFITDRSVC